MGWQWLAVGRTWGWLTASFVDAMKVDGSTGESGEASSRLITLAATENAYAFQPLRVVLSSRRIGLRVQTIVYHLSI